ncbi:MAG TPA: amidohydrolase family protein [Ignavibacteriales bacterium]|nr:amidohydrolase family protein [Ignavibacteriales bacterium]
MKKILFFLVLSACNSLSAQNSYKGPVIDTHCHVSIAGERVTSGSRSADIPVLSKIYSDSKFEKAGLIVFARKGQIEKTMAKNDSLIDFCRKNPKYYPICSVHPDDGEAAVKEIERVYKRGVRFLKFHSAAQNFDPSSESARTVFQKASDLRMTMLFDGWNPLDANLVGKLISVAVSMPDGRFIIAHMGGPNFNQLLLLTVYENQPWYKKNIWVDISALSMLYEDSPYIEQIKWTIRKIGTDRVLFGSDYPYMPVEDAIKSVEKLALSPDEMNAVMYGNARELLRMSEEVSLGK